MLAPAKLQMTKGGLLAGALIGGLIFGTAHAQSISGSKHDLSSSNTTAPTPPDVSGSENQVCVFCHTPHGADTSAAAPLWNKPSQTASYTTYSTLNTSTLDGEEHNSVGSVSAACLSCHDGTQAMDMVVNMAGSGGYNAGGSAIDSNDSLAEMTEASSGVAMLGTDLQNDHPISIQYGGGGIDANSPSGTLADPDFKQPNVGTFNGTQVWWVETDNDGTRDKQDMILYTRQHNSVNQPFVECGSCHDPHEAGSSPVSFLRVDNDTNGSDVCLACHTK